MRTVYLVGVICEDPKSHEWRKEASKLLRPKFTIIDPTATRFDKETLKEANGDAETLHRLVDRHQSEILLPKSYQSVNQADIMLANLSLEASDRPMVGSIMEIAWAYHANKTIIAIRGENYYSRHPMVKGCVHAWASDVEEACYIIKFYFSE